jgi:hypothetical protein
VLHESRQGHVERAGQLRDRTASVGERFDDLAPRRVGKRGKNRVEPFL